MGEQTSQDFFKILKSIIQNHQNLQNWLYKNHQNFVKKILNIANFAGSRLPPPRPFAAKNSSSTCWPWNKIDLRNCPATCSLKYSCGWATKLGKCLWKNRKWRVKLKSLRKPFCVNNFHKIVHSDYCPQKYFRYVWIQYSFDIAVVYFHGEEKLLRSVLGLYGGASVLRIFFKILVMRANFGEFWWFWIIDFKILKKVL